MTSNSDARALSLPGAGVALPLLHTKLNVPRSGAGLLPRARLTERLNAGTAGRLTMVSAPAGFGKTTLLAEWLAGSAAAGRGIAWVSLDASENDPALFWSYVVRALQRVQPSIGREVVPLLEPSARTIDAALTSLLNEIAAADTDITLVLDDYHVIETASVHDGLAFLIDHQPPGLHVVIASRFDPPLPLARLRARGELTELRSADLRFSADEAATLLNDVLALDLPPAQLQELEARTEGWVTALKLAALARRTRDADSGDRAAFRAANGYIADYVIDEVLLSEPEHVRSFLLATSILERLSGPLCDAVSGQPGSRRLLQTLARRNLFVVQLDEDGTWYRYHHLFAEVIQLHARRADPELLAEAHRRASSWYREHGSPLDAVGHAQAAADDEAAAEILELQWPEKNRSHESRRWLRLAQALPERVLDQRPVLAMAYAWALLNSGDAAAADALLRRVEEWLQSGGGPDERRPVVLDESRYRTLPAELAAARGYLAQMKGDAQGTIANARRALELIPEADHAGRATGTALVALALWSNGRLEEAYETFSAALSSMRRAGRTLDAIRGTFVLGDLRAAQGRLREAAAIHEVGLRLAGDCEDALAAETDELLIGLAEVHIEQGDVATAESLLDRVRASWGPARHAGNRYRWCTASARVRLARGDERGALAYLTDAETVQQPSPLPEPRPVAAMKARILISQGRLAEALAWAEASRVTPDDDLTWLREFEHLTLARLLLARYRAEQEDGALPAATALLERLADAAERGGRKGSRIEALALLGLALLAGSQVRVAVDRLGQALTLAEPDGWVRVFVDEGAPMRDLLRHALARAAAPAYAQRLLSFFDATGGREAAAPSKGDASPLTDREEVILRLLSTGLRNQEIAQHLFISTATVKRHVANIYLKLGVGHRTAALARATELKLL